MAGKSVTINTDELERWFASVKSWLTQFFSTMDTYEMIAVAAIGVGLILVILGLILM